MSDSLSSLMTKEQLWANRSQFLLKRATSVICSWFEWIPSWFEQITLKNFFYSCFWQFSHPFLCPRAISLPSLSLQKSDCERFALFQKLIALSLTKTSNSLEKPMSEFPALILAMNQTGDCSNPFTTYSWHYCQMEGWVEGEGDRGEGDEGGGEDESVPRWMRIFSFSTLAPILPRGVTPSRESNSGHIHFIRHWFEIKWLRGRIFLFKFKILFKHKWGVFEFFVRPWSGWDGWVFAS